MGVLIHSQFLLALFLDLASGSLVEVAEQAEGGRNASKKTAPIPAPKPDVSEAGTNAGEPERSDSDESDDSI